MEPNIVSKKREIYTGFCVYRKSYLRWSPEYHLPGIFFLAAVKSAVRCPRCFCVSLSIVPPWGYVLAHLDLGLEQTFLQGCSTLQKVFEHLPGRFGSGPFRRFFKTLMRRVGSPVPFPTRPDPSSGLTRPVNSPAFVVHAFVGAPSTNIYPGIVGFDSCVDGVRFWYFFCFQP